MCLLSESRISLASWGPNDVDSDKIMRPAREGGQAAGKGRRRGAGNEFIAAH